MELKREDIIENKIAKIIRKASQLSRLLINVYLNVNYSGHVDKFEISLLNKTNYNKIINYELYLNFDNTVKKLDEIENELDKKINELTTDLENEND